MTLDKPRGPIRTTAVTRQALREAGSGLDDRVRTIRPERTELGDARPTVFLASKSYIRYERIDISSGRFGFC